MNEILEEVAKYITTVSREDFNRDFGKYAKSFEGFGNYSGEEILREMNLIIGYYNNSKPQEKQITKPKCLQV